MHARPFIASAARSSHSHEEPTLRATAQAAAARDAAEGQEPALYCVAPAWLHAACDWDATEALDQRLMTPHHEATLRVPTPCRGAPPASCVDRAWPNEGALMMHSKFHPSQFEKVRMERSWMLGRDICQWNFGT